MGESDLKVTGRPISSPRRSLEDESKASTLAPSHEPSVMENAEQPTGHPAIATESEHKNNEVVHEKDRSAGSKEVALDAASDGEESEDESHYPKGFKLVLISVALCLSVFCMALVRTFSRAFAFFCPITAESGHIAAMWLMAFTMAACSFSNAICSSANAISFLSAGFVVKKLAAIDNATRYIAAITANPAVNQMIKHRFPN